MHHEKRRPVLSNYYLGQGVTWIDFQSSNFKIMCMTKYALSFFIAAIALSSCGIINMKTEKGNGRTQTENRSQKNFRGIESYGSFDVYVTADSSYAVKIETDENLLQYIQTSIEDGNLKITTASGVSLDPVNGIKVYVSAPVFNKLTTSGSGSIIGQNKIISDENLDLGISGSGDIKLDVKAPAVSADISGSGDIDVTGDAKSFKTSIAGNGSIKAGKLLTEESTVSIAGSGDAFVNASKQLNVHIAGSGDVKYTGSPSINQDVAGSGSIQKAE